MLAKNLFYQIYTFFTLNPWEKSRKNYKICLFMLSLFSIVGLFHFFPLVFLLHKQVELFLIWPAWILWTDFSYQNGQRLTFSQRLGSFESHHYVTFLLGEISFWLTSEATFMLKNLASYFPNPEISSKSIINICAHIYAYKDIHTYIYMNMCTKINLVIFYMFIASITTNIQTSL